MKSNLLNALKVGGLLAALAVIVVVFYDQLFSKPKIHQGIIIDKIEIPKNKVAGLHVLPYGGSRSYKYTISSEKYHQWIALVKSDDNDTLKVHCSSDHFFNRDIGDTILFKEYKGDLLKIDYLIHSEEDTLQTDWDKVFKH